MNRSLLGGEAANNITRRFCGVCASRSCHRALSSLSLPRYLSQVHPRDLPRQRRKYIRASAFRSRKSGTVEIWVCDHVCNLKRLRCTALSRFVKHCAATVANFTSSLLSFYCYDAYNDDPNGLKTVFPANYHPCSTATSFMSALARFHTGAAC